MRNNLALDMMEDEQLMRLYQDGDEEAFRVLYSRFSPKVYGYLKKRIKDENKVAEIFQEAFIKVHRSKHLYNQSFALAPWIFTVVKTAMLDELSKAKNKIEATEYDDTIRVENLRTSVGIDTEILLEKLPAQQRQVVEMRYIEEKNFDEIAESLSLSSNNVRKIVSRGIKRLKELIREGGKW